LHLVAPLGVSVGSICCISIDAFSCRQWLTSRSACPVFGLDPERMWAAMIFGIDVCRFVIPRTRACAQRVRPRVRVTRDSAGDHRPGDVQVVSRYVFPPPRSAPVSVPKCGLSDPTPPRCRQPPAPTPACPQYCIAIWRYLHVRHTNNAWAPYRRNQSLIRCRSCHVALPLVTCPSHWLNAAQVRPQQTIIPQHLEAQTRNTPACEHEQRFSKACPQEIAQQRGQDRGPFPLSWCASTWTPGTCGWCELRLKRQRGSTPLAALLKSWHRTSFQMWHTAQKRKNLCLAHSAHCQTSVEALLLSSPPHYSRLPTTGRRAPSGAGARDNDDRASRLCFPKTA
jgi:hypothetical protein